jgi:hypothetical protein
MVLNENLNVNKNEDWI